ncbi:ANR family transcriptional regulator [Serratia nevei]|uniref:ANR family transcriptional regulator n=1 Tax=Serratia nevei TaxID=2703794 RepID=UPI003FA78F1D
MKCTNSWSYMESNNISNHALDFQSEFENISEYAARLERQGHWHEAADLWFMAGQYSTNSKNRDWSFSRYLFCERMCRTIVLG